MNWTFWVLAVLCALLTGALAAALSRVYALSLRPTPAAGSDPAALPEGWEKLDELLTMLLGLQEKGISNSGSVSRQDFAKAVLDGACSLMRCARGSVMLWDEKDGCLKIAAVKSPFAGGPQQLFLKPGEGIAGKAFASAQAILVSDPQKDPRYIQTDAEAAEAFLSIPLLVKSKPIGVLNLHAGRDSEPFTGYRSKFLTILAGEAAVMLHNQDLLDNLQTFYLEMAQTLARACDFKDGRSADHADHADRARREARLLADELGLPDQMGRYIEYAALLHDIGKIAVDEALLSKPGRLTKEEYELIKKHPVTAHRILSPVKYLGPVAQMVLYHQERYDGTGYPEALKGEEIPLGARLIAVIDAWESMTTDRPYRKAMTRAAAVEELRRGAGTQFDPRIVAAFLKVAEKAATAEAAA